jgi:hypothetical protein
MHSLTEKDVVQGTARCADLDPNVLQFRFERCRVGVAGEVRRRNLQTVVHDLVISLEVRTVVSRNFDLIGGILYENSALAHHFCRPDDRDGDGVYEGCHSNVGGLSRHQSQLDDDTEQRLHQFCRRPDVVDNRRRSWIGGS